MARGGARATAASAACARMVCVPVGRATQERTAPSVPAPSTATAAAAVRMGAACATQATPGPSALPAPAPPTAGAVGTVCRELACAVRAIAARTAGRKRLPPVPALGAAGPGNCAEPANVYAWRASEALTAPFRRALGTAVAGESVVRAAASAKTAMQGRTVEKVSRQPFPVCSVRAWESEPVGRPQFERPRIPGTWRKSGGRSYMRGVGSQRSQGASVH